MSNTERENFKAEILNDFVKKWKPVVIAFFSVVGVTITTTWWIAHNIATTSDVQRVSNGIDSLNKNFYDLNASFNNHVEMGNATKVQLFKSKDSLAKVTRNIENRLNTRYVDVTQYKDKNGIHYKNYN